MVILIGVIGLGLCLWVAQWDIERLRWPTTKAKVVEMDTRGTTDSEGIQLEVPYAKFEYQVGGRQYRQNANVGLATKSRSALESARRDFAAGRELEIPFNSANPSEIRPSARITGIALAALVMVVVVSLCAALSGVGMVFKPPLRLSSS